MSLIPNAFVNEEQPYYVPYYAGGGGGSNLTQWATFPAVSNINANGNDIDNINTLDAGQVNGIIGNFQILNTSSLVASSIIVNTLFYQSVIQSNVVINTSTITTNALSTNSISTNSITLQTINNIPFSSILSSIQAGTSNGAQWSFYPALNPVQLNNYPLTSSNITLNASNDINLNGNDVFLTADEGANPNVANINLIAKNGVGGSINLTADTGVGGTSYGAINLTANGGTTAGIGTGGSINIVANTPVGTLSNASSKVSINASGVNVYAGAVAPVASLTGYLFNYGTLGINNCVGLPSVIPNFPGTLYNYATGGIGYGGIRFESPAGVELINNTDLYAYRMYPYFNPFAVGTLPDMLISGRTHTLQNTQYLNLELVKNIKFGDNSNEGVITGVSSINGIPYPPPSGSGSVFGGSNIVITPTNVVNLVPGITLSSITGSSNLDFVANDIETFANSLQLKTNNPMTGLYLNDGDISQLSSEDMLVLTSLAGDIHIDTTSTLILEASTIKMDKSPLFVSSLTVSSINGQAYPPPSGSGGIQSLVGGNQIFITNQSTINVSPSLTVSSLSAVTSGSILTNMNSFVFSNVYLNRYTTTPWFSPTPSVFYIQIPDTGYTNQAWYFVGTDMTTTYYNNLAPQWRFTGVYYTSNLQKVIVPNWADFLTNSNFPVGAYVETFVTPLDTGIQGIYYIDKIITPSNRGYFYAFDKSSSNTIEIMPLTLFPYQTMVYTGSYIGEQSVVQPSYVSTPQLFVSSINGLPYVPGGGGGSNPVVSTFNSVLLTPSTLLTSASNFSQLNVLNSSNLSSAQVLGSSYIVSSYPGDPNFGAYGRDITNRATYLGSNGQLNRLAYTTDSNIAVSTLSVDFIRFQAGQYSTLMYVSSPVTAGVASNMLYIDRNSDFSVFNNNILCGQIKIGFNQVAGSAGSNRRAELTFYNQVDTGYDLNVQNGDYAIRYATSQSTLVGSNEGYLLDTRVNNPFFSTINNSLHLMAKFFPAQTQGTIGASTMSILQNYVWSGYSSNTQQVVGANTITPLSFTTQTANIGGFTQLGSTITIPASGLYSLDCSIQFITSSSGKNTSYFFLQKNGVPVPQTSSRVSINNNADTVGTVVFTEFANQGDQYSFCIYSDDAQMTAGAVPAGAIPAVPSLIANIRKIG